MKSTKTLSYIFAIVGLGFLIGTVFITNNTIQFVAKSKTAPGKVVEMVRNLSRDSDNNTTYMYAPIVEFKTMDNELIRFESSFSSNPPAYEVNEKVEVLYPAASPREAKINSFFSLWFSSLLLGSFGVIFGGVGFGMLIARLKRDGLIKKLLASGQRVEADIKQVILNQSLKVNGRSPYKILCQYDHGGEVLLLESDNIWFDPTEYIKNPKIAVFLDPANHKNYYVDISFLPQVS